MLFAPVRLGSTALSAEVLTADVKNCKHFGPCGVGEKALYLNGFLFDRHYYVALGDIRRVFKRVAMSKGGFTGNGVFGAIPYLVVEYGDGTQKQCTFKREDNVDDLLAYLAKVCPGLPLHSVQAEQRLARKAQEEAVRYLDVLTPEAQAAREKLEKARTFLAGYPKLTDRLSTAAKAKRVNEHTNPAHKWVALAIVLAGLIAAVYGVIAWRRQEGFGMYFTLLGLAVVFLFSGTQVIPTMRNNKRAVTAAWEQAQKDIAGVLPEHFPLPARYAHPVVLDRMIRVLREGRAQNAEEALAVVKADLKALNADVQVSQEEYDEVVAIKPKFLVSNYERSYYKVYRYAKSGGHRPPLFCCALDGIFRAFLIQQLFPLLPVRQVSLQQRVKAGAVVHFPEMAQFMDHHQFHCFLWTAHQVAGKAQTALAGAAPVAFSGRGDPKTGGVDLHDGTPVSHFLRQNSLCLCFQRLSLRSIRRRQSGAGGLLCQMADDPVLMFFYKCVDLPPGDPQRGSDDQPSLPRQLQCQSFPAGADQFIRVHKSSIAPSSSP